MNNHYETLGLKPTASQEEIKNAYHKLSEKFHPDNNGGDEYFAEMFKDFKEAYEVLIDKENKSSYKGPDITNSDSNLKETNKDLNPEILLFESDKDSFEEGESIRLRWKTKNVDKVIIKPFGTVENSGTKVFKLKNYNKDTLSITLHATNKLIDETITKTIKLKNNVIELDFAAIQEDEEVKTSETLKEEVELPKPVKEEPKVHANSFEPPIAKSTNETKESFFSSAGRIRRSTYLLRMVFLALPASFAYLALDGSSNSYNSPNETTLIFSGLALIVISYLSILQFIKRLHDITLSGWWTLLSLIPVAGGLFGFVVLFINSSKGANKYGADPKNL